MRPLPVALTTLLTATGCAHRTMRPDDLRDPPKNMSFSVDPGSLAHLDRNTLAAIRIDTPPFGHGSGVVIGRGHILTAAHVIASTCCPVVTIDGRTYEAVTVAADPLKDIAVVRIGTELPDAAALGASADVSNGDLVYSVGFPDEPVKNVDTGHVAKAKFRVDLRPMRDYNVEAIRFDDLTGGAGSSGAGVFSAKSGKLVGMRQKTVWVQNDEGKALSFRIAISADDIRAFLDAHRVPYYKGPP